jgi:hypothetical protein
MNKEQILLIQTEANKVIHEVYEAVKNLTAENPLILFEGENVDVDEILDLPYGYNVGKYEEYQQGAIRRVCGEEVELFLTGDFWGETLHTELCQITFDQQIDLLTYLSERL